ncbi:MAG: hypothetical protein R3F49_19350 [Planctomycetota bacterium]
MITTLPRASAHDGALAVPALVRPLTAALALALSPVALAQDFARLGHVQPTIVTQSFGPSVTYALANDDDCATSTDMQMGPGFYVYDLNGATAGIQGQGNQLCNYFGLSNIDSDIWFRWTATWTGRVEMSTCGDATDSRIAVYSGGSSCPTTNALACNDDACGFQSNLVFDVQNGTTYLVQLGTYPGAAQNSGTLTVTDLAATCGYQADPDTGRLDGIGLTNGGEIAYLNYFEAAGGADILTEVSVAYGTVGGNLPDGNTARVLIWNDPTNDADPNDATVLWSLNTTTTLSNTGTLTAYPVPNIPVTGGFWVGAIVQHAATEFAAVYDQSQNSFGRSWLAGQVGGQVDPMNLSASGVAPIPVNALVVALGADGFFLVRASGQGNNCGGGTIGTNYCSANVNSTGTTGVATALGSSLIANNNVQARASSLPANVFGFFITSRTQGFVANPGGSSGNLCLAGAIGRYLQQIQSSGAAGEFTINIDVTAMPAPNGSLAVQAGETWNFQAWHRDAISGVATSNFTNGVAVTFQ